MISGGSPVLKNHHIHTCRNAKEEWTDKPQQIQSKSMIKSYLQHSNTNINHILHLNILSMQFYIACPFPSSVTLAPHVRFPALQPSGVAPDAGLGLAVATATSDGTRNSWRLTTMNHQQLPLLQLGYAIVHFLSGG